MPEIQICLFQRKLVADVWNLRAGKNCLGQSIMTRTEPKRGPSCCSIHLYEHRMNVHISILKYLICFPCFPPYLHSGNKCIWMWVILYQLKKCGFLMVSSCSTIFEEYYFEIFSLQLRNYIHKEIVIDQLRQEHNIVSVLWRHLLMLWMSHSWTRSRPGSTWSNERWPCSWQRGWNKVVLKVFANRNYFMVLFQTFMFKG